LKLFHSPASPFARKCLVVAAELGLSDRIELVTAAVSPVSRDPDVVAHNPLGKIPTLVTDEGMVLYDSRVICVYLDALGGNRLIPAEGSARLRSLVEQALGDGIDDAAVLARYETTVRPEALRWDDWLTGQFDKVRSGLAEIERRARHFGDRVDIGTIAIGCALGYLDYRHPALAWRDGHPNAAAWFAWFDGRDSMVATRPPPA
jgi:glutathione S-transferase